MPEATAFWITGPGRGELRREQLDPPGPDQVLVETRLGAISRGTEALVFKGRVPESQHVAMRAPHQAGEFTFPVKYGYSSLGVVVDGDEAWRGRRVYCLHPHQDRYVVGANTVLPVPDAVPDARAVLAANLETAINGLWDAPPRVGDRVAVVGAGVVGVLAAALASRVPGTSVELVDVDPAKARLAEALGIDFALPGAAVANADLVVHASGTAAGLATALRLSGFEATVLELSWYGRDLVEAPLGETFHSKRLVLRSSQVGAVATAQRARWDNKRRLALALGLLEDARFDTLLEPAVPFARLPETMAALAEAPNGIMCQVISYP